MFTKILQISAAYKPAYIYGGPTMSVAKLCEALTKANVPIEVLTTTANGQTELKVKPNEAQNVDGVAVSYFKRLTKDHTHFSPALLKALKSKIKQDKQVVVHIHAWWNLVSLLSCQVAKWNKVPVVLSPRGMLTDYTLGNRNASFKSIIHRFMGKRLLRYCHIHVTSEKEKQDVLRFIQPKSTTVIPNLVELGKSEVAKPKNITSAQFRLIFLSRIEEKKGLELLLKALANVSFDWSLSLAGSGTNAYVESLQLLAQQLGIASNISWIGQVKPEDKFEVLAQHDLMALTSYNENFANVVVESLSVGTPVLLSDQVGLADYVLEKELGWISTLNIENIVEQLTKAYQAKAQREQIRQIAPDLIATDFNPAQLVQKYISLYQKVQ
ncbi:glycosyltransferase [Pedobacter sp. KR3-3]|uniref:Glycosyltransferase n=1 Tax=Pedobacter albus TaxID=3113905 RepID=A0ABU7I6R1_9SPHI|nr:glycosyltransferase [Pedobacter sp. KR3-3]MEE1945155.1 glycosyltransferase [Pedobacter sp. KR3-3]